MTTDGPPRLVAGEIVERLDDAEHRAEQADERRVRAQRGEKGQVPLEAQLLARLRALDGGRQIVARRAVSASSTGRSSARSRSSARMSASSVALCERWVRKYQSRSSMIARLTTLSATSSQSTQPAPWSVNAQESAEISIVLRPLLRLLVVDSAAIYCPK